jgi:hypothetical protein
MSKFLSLFFIINAFNLFSQALIRDVKTWNPYGTVYSTEVDTSNNRLIVGGSFNYIGPEIKNAVEIDKNTLLPK